MSRNGCWLEGSGALAARRVDVVEFEYMRAWKAQLGQRALHDTLAGLDGGSAAHDT